MNEARLPEGWRIAKIGNEFIIVTGNTPLTKEPLNYGNDIPFVKPPDLLYASITKTQDYLSARGAQKSRILPENSILVSCIGNLGKVGINRLPVAFNQQINAIVVDNSNSPEWVFYYCQTQAFRNDLHSLSSATTIPIVNKSKFEGVRIPLPPLPVQHQIVARIEELFSEIDAGVQELQTALKRLKIYRQAVSHHYLSNPSWELVKLGDVAVKIRNGISAKPDKEKGLKILRINAVRPNQLYQNEVRYLEERQEYKSYILVDGDLLFTRYNGSVDYTGVCAVFRHKSAEPITHPDKLIRVVLDSSICIPEFVSYASNSGESRRFVRNRIKTTAGQSGISGGDIKSIPIALPNINTQAQIVSEIEARLSEADAIEATIRQELVRAENLRQSILKRAFEGKLVNQTDRDIPEKTTANSSQMIPSAGQLSLF